MDTLLAIGLGLGLRAFVDAYAAHDYKVSGTLVGLWEGAVLSHFLDKRPRSTDPYFALGARLLIDLLITESFMRFTIVMIWAVLGLVFTDLISNLWYRGGLRSAVKSLTRTHRSRTVSSSSSSRRRRPSSASVSSLPFPFFKSLTSSRVHFYELPAASLHTNTISLGSSDSQSGSDSTIRSPRSILRSPSSSTIETLAPRRLRSDIVPGSWSETETITDGGLTESRTRTYVSPNAIPTGTNPVIREVSAMRSPPVILEPVTVLRQASVVPAVVRSPTELSRAFMTSPVSPISTSSGSRHSSIAQPAVALDQPAVSSPPRSRAASSIPAVPTRTSSNEDYGILLPPRSRAASSIPSRAAPSRGTRALSDDDYQVDSGMEEGGGLTSPSESSSTGYPAISQVLRPPSSAPRASVHDDDDLGYVEPGQRTPRSVQSSVPPVMLPPLRSSGTLGSVPDFHNIPEIYLPTPTANPSQPSLLPPSPSAIPDMTPGEQSSVRQLGHEPSASSLNERPMSGPPPYAADTPPAWPEPFMPLTDVVSEKRPLSAAAKGKEKDRESVFSTSTSLLLRDADELYATAQEKEKEGKRLDNEIKKASREKRFHDALKHKVQKEEAEEDARKARERAEQKIYRANNRKLSAQQIDVHGLRTAEAARRTEKAIAESYERGEMELILIVGPTEKGQVPVKPTIHRTLRDHKITFRDDPDNVNQVLVSLPYPSII